MKLEEQIKPVLLAFLEIALGIKAERERQRLAEIERRRQEKLRTVEGEELQGLVAKRQEETVDFLAWAQHYIDQLDPLCTTPHDPDFEAERPGYYISADKQVHETLDRLLGNHWSDAFKLGQYPADEPPSPGSIALGYSRRRPRISPPARPSE